MKARLTSLVALLTAASVASAAPSVTNTALFQLDKSDYVFYRGEVSLSAEGFWDVSVATSVTDVIQLYMIPPAKTAEIQMGRRMLAVENERQVRQGQYAVSQLYWPCREYAKQHENIGPAAVTNLDAKKYPYVMESIKRSPYATGTNGSKGPFVFLVPSVKFDGTADNQVPDAAHRKALAVELQPYVDDGKHWVAFTDGSCTREPIDPELVKNYSLTIRPMVTKPAGPTTTNALPGDLVYRIVAVRQQGATNPIPLVIRNAPSSGRVNVVWDLAGARTDEKTVMADLRVGRAVAWTPYAMAGDSIVLNTWLASVNGRLPNVNGDRGSATSLFGLFGGRAAMQETLQLQNVGPTRDDASQRTIPVETLKGVEVKSHPYNDMLRGGKGGELPLANVVPCDRVFVHVARPETLLPFLDSGAGFLSLLGTTFTGNSVEYDLKGNYMSRLGATNEWLRLFLRPEVVKEMALVFPDLFFIDGTDVTIVSRLTQPKLIQDLLKLLGVANLTADNVVTRDVGGGRSAFWALRNDLLVTSTSRSELDAVLTLQKNAGKDSLGQSAEFRYMLTQLPARSLTRMYAYFSDPFIRRQVGPAVKIGQLRRTAAHAAMERVAASALLARLDGIRSLDSVEALAGRGYLQTNDLNDSFTIDTNLVVSSKLYGPLTRMNTLTEVPVEKITPAEAATYKTYVDNYSRYWRRYFDPIAIRLDDAPGDSIEATTFILPLIDNTAYNGLREALLTREDSVELKAPGLAPEPVIMLSLNLRDESWRKIAEGLSEIFMQYGGVSPAVLDDLGPGLHLAIHDADPVIALGSGDLLGALNANLLGAGGGRGGEMMFIPVALSVLTRPCSLIVETRNPERTRQFLRQTTAGGVERQGRFNRGTDVNFYQVEGQDSWICSLDIMGLLKLRYGLEVQGSYVVVRNIPWSNKDRVARMDTAPLNGACLQAYPDACEMQLAGLFAAEQDRSLLSARQGLSALYPLVASGYATPDKAAAEQARLFGFKPIHPGDGKWVWDNYELTSSQYGSVHRQKQPAYAKDKSRFGLFNDIETLCVGMQFEDTGLRTVIRWKPK